MKNIKSVFILVFCGLCLLTIAGCSGKSEQKGEEQTAAKADARPQVKMSLVDKTLPEIKESVNGKWELISGQNASQLCEFENTFITFDNDKYIWTEDGKDEPGDLNWRKAPTGNGYDAYLMDVFYATNPSYPLAINDDTLYIQDCTGTAYKYMLIRR